MENEDRLREQLHEAVRNGDYAGMQGALDEGVLVGLAVDDAETVLSFADRWGTALHVACSPPGGVTGRLDCIRVLLNAGSDANAIAPQNGRTPLHFAFKGRSAFSPQYWSAARVLELLVQEGANICARDFYNCTPFDICQQTYPRTKTEIETKLAITACFLDLYCNHVVQQEGDNSLHALFAAAAFEAPDDMELPPVIQWSDDDTGYLGDRLLYPLRFRADGCVQLPLGTLTVDHVYSLLKLVVARRPVTIHTLNENGMTPLAAACQMNAPVFVVEFLLRHDPNSLSDIVLPE